MAKRPVPLYDFAAFGQATQLIFLRVTLPILKIRDNNQACKSFMRL